MAHYIDSVLRPMIAAIFDEAYHSALQSTCRTFLEAKKEGHGVREEKERR